ncbi:HPr family phosphocarrier protein [Neobacillus cucumis]|uniref:HPr family phosphocarrier protein n=1 Tax=Neobacillus cucumis TaxID=1740721 RepID=UPI0028533159|nr:HPr family phosphocarrier protein [Neobacillus cucumis]MDR4945954.1 HPr family phosphocarrier protein [Neobacillus cucumis]
MKKEVAYTLTQDFNYHDQLTQLVQEANRFNSYILMKYKNLQINVKSFLSIRILRISKGETLNIFADGNDAERAIDHISSFLIKKGIILGESNVSKN